MKPGLDTGPGTLNIVGNFTMTESGTLYINISAAGNTDLLRVQSNAQGQGGTVTLSGVLYVDKNIAYKPGVNTTLTFMEYVQAISDFDATSFSNQFWTIGQDTFYFDPVQQATSYRLVVKKV